MTDSPSPDEHPVLCHVDIVVDTNIWIHAGNPGVDKYTEAQRFVLALYGSETILCFDVGAANNEATNRSKILSEYKERVGGSGVGQQILSALLQSGRWASVSSTVTNAQRQIINQNVPDASDRVFAKVATNSDSRALISHDEAAFHANCKKALAKKCGVAVQSCSEVLAA